MNCQVVIESLKGTCFTDDVVSLKQRKVSSVSVTKELCDDMISLMCTFLLPHQFSSCGGQDGSLMSNHSQLSGNRVREIISSLSV